MEQPPYPYAEFALKIGEFDLYDHALLDTGFEGDLIIPAGYGRELVRPYFDSYIVTADGQAHRVRTWRGVLALGDGKFTVEVKAFSNWFIVGRGVLDQGEICFDHGKGIRMHFGDAPLEIISGE